MVLRTWPPLARGYPAYIAPEILPFLASNRTVAASPLSWTGVEDEPLHIDSGDEDECVADNNDVCIFLLLFIHVTIKTH